MQHGWTALMRATSRGHMEVVKLLVQAGADVNTRDRAVRALQMYACWLILV